MAQNPSFGKVKLILTFKNLDFIPNYFFVFKTAASAMQAKDFKNLMRDPEIFSDAAYGIFCEGTVCLRNNNKKQKIYKIHHIPETFFSTKII